MPLGTNIELWMWALIGVVAVGVVVVVFVVILRAGILSRRPKATPPPLTE